MPTLTLLLALVVVWSVVWKGIALWRAARNYQRGWFIALLILNTAGILEIVYLLWFRRDKQPETKSLFNNPLPKPDDSGSETSHDTSDTTLKVAETPGA